MSFPPLPRVSQWAQVLGNPAGKIQVTLFIDVLCPFAAKQYRTLTRQVLPKHDDLGVSVLLYSQPWHLTVLPLHFSTIAARQLNPAHYQRAIDVLVDSREKWVNLHDSSFNQIVQQVGDAFSNAIPDFNKEKFLNVMKPESAQFYDEIVTEVKFTTRFGRQNSVHVTPTVLVNGLHNGAIDSSFSEEQWDQLLSHLRSQKIPIQ